MKVDVGVFREVGTGPGGGLLFGFRREGFILLLDGGAVLVILFQGCFKGLQASFETRCDGRVYFEVSEVGGVGAVEYGVAGGEQLLGGEAPLGVAGWCVGWVMAASCCSETCGRMRCMVSAS